MKNIFTLFVLFLPFFAAAQKTHTVSPKETLYSIGRLYNVHPKELASFNNISFDKGLSEGQVIKIPAKTSMQPLAAVSMEKPVAADKPVVVEKTAAVEKPVAEKLPAPENKKPISTVAASEKKPIPKDSVPIYHMVAPKEGLYGITKKYNISYAQIREWNGLKSDALKQDMVLVVGYQKIPVLVREVDTSFLSKLEKGILQKPEESAKQQPQKEASKQQRKEEQHKQQAQDDAVPLEPQEVYPTKSIDFGGGVFKADYNLQVNDKAINEENGMCGVFKSTSGWENGKYYCLHNEAPIGSYVKITNNATRKSIYAKVLDLIPNLKQNAALLIRVSNAAAAELGADTVEFDCTIHY
jgi:LysM repeat protein